MVATSVIIYIGHFLSSWGDRMWHFAIPLFLLDLEPLSLTLSAAYGLTLASSVLFFGPLIGDWIDRSPRLYCARISLIIQNTMVVVCAVILLLNKEFNKDEVVSTVLVKIGAIFLGAIAQMASTATAIIIQKDWIIVVAGENKNMLAHLNSTTRRIDLFTKILAPVACGQIMTLVGLSGGAIFIMSWNVVSMFLEYYLLRVVYKQTPALSNKRQNVKAREDEELNELKIANDFPVSADSTAQKLIKNENVDENCVSKCDDKDMRKVKQTTKANTFIHVVLRKMFGFLVTLKNGWSLYIAQPIALPCIGFSFLYMTILGFGYITTAYAYSQCLSELSVGLMQAAAAITGIVATFMYPPMRRKYGIVNAGLFSAIFQLLTLIPCLVSIFVAGSPFFILESQNPNNGTVPSDMTTVAMTNFSPSYAFIESSNQTSQSSAKTSQSNLFIKCLKEVELPSSFLSMVLLMTGIILARIGLWGFDLTITQIIQESVDESERGIFNGVQTSLNNLMDLLRYVFVLILPLPNQFGILVVLSSVFIVSGYVLYFIYAKKVKQAVE